MQPTCLIKCHNGFSSTKASPVLHILIHFLPYVSTMVSRKIDMLLTYDLQTFWRLAKHMQGAQIGKTMAAMERRQRHIDRLFYFKVK
ncbi:hypothetical protein QL285_075970 [Trifolium repens]|nr:hypothetical protein QL285_075970 [Trifolium repens]